MASDALPEIDALKAALHEATARALRVEAELAIARAKASDDEAAIAKLRRELHGQRSERAERLLDQMELGLEEVESAATKDEIAAEMAAARATTRTGVGLAIRIIRLSVSTAIAISPC